MTVFRSFFQVAKRNLWPVFAYVGIMVLMTWLIVSSVGDRGQQLTVATQDYQIAIINHDEGDELSQALVSFLADRAQIKDIGQGEKAVRDALFWNDVSYVLEIPQGFGAALVRGEQMQVLSYVSPNDYVHMYIDAHLNRFLATVQVYMGQMPADSLGESIRRAEKDLLEETAILPANNQPQQGWSKGIYFYFTYVSYPLLAAISSGMGIVLTVVLQKKLMFRNRVGSLSEAGRNVQLALAGLCYSSLIWLLLVACGLVLIGIELSALREPRFLYMLGASYLYMLTCMAITLLITAFTTKSHVISSVSNVVALGSSFLGGIFVPAELLGDHVLRLGKLLPAYWYTQAIKTVGEAVSMNPELRTQFWQQLTIVALMLATLLISALIVNKYKRQRGI